MSRGNPWTSHYQSVWTERGKNPELPQWLRLACLAFGRHKPNGHAHFAEGELAKLLSTRGKDGAVTVPSSQSVSGYIKTAKHFEFIDQSSTARCLVVPPHAITGGQGGSPWARCVIHDKSSITAA